jgi:hypothetical protein
LKEGKMPSYFKALATIMVWVMWLVGMAIGFGTLAMGIIRGDLFSSEVPPPMVIPALWAVALAYGIGAVVVMILRKKME